MLQLSYLCIKWVIMFVEISPVAVVRGKDSSALKRCSLWNKKSVVQ